MTGEYRARARTPVLDLGPGGGREFLHRAGVTAARGDYFEAYPSASSITSRKPMCDIAL